MSRIINKKVNTRIISVLFAVALWLYVAGDQNPMEPKNIKDVPVNLINTETVLSSGLIIKDPQQYKIEVNVQGKRSVLAEVKAGEIIAEADLRGHTQKGVNNVPVEIRGLPTNVQLVDFNPKIVKVDMEQISSTQVPVIVSTAGKPMQGYTALAPVITPGEVLVSGPESLLGNIKVTTAVMKLEGALEDLKEVLAVKAVDAENNDIAGVTLVPNIVDVVIPVRKTKQVDIKPVIEGHPSHEWDITDIYTDKNTIVVYGEKSILQGIDSINTEPISIEGIDQNMSYNAGLIMPEGVAPVERTDSVTLYVRGERIIIKEITAGKVSLEGLEEGLELSNETVIPAVRVTVRGKESLVNELALGNLSVDAALDGLRLGKHTLGLRVNLPEGVQLIKVTPSEIEIELKASREGGD